MYYYFICFVISLYVIFDVNYFVRTYFTVLSGKICQRIHSINEVTTIYGICTFQDCDVWFRNIRVARLIREVDIARYHFYHRTGIYQRSREMKIRSLQGCTLTIDEEPVPLFALYKIRTKLVYWDDCSLFFEHEIITLHDGRLKYFIVSRQHAIGVNGDSSDALLHGLPGFEERPKCPNHIEQWLKSMRCSSRKLRKTK